MRNFLHALGTCIGAIIAVPILIVLIVAYLMFVPFDILRYHHTPYYKDFKIKYQFFLTSRIQVRLYNAIVRAQLPIKYFRNNDFEYFIKDGQILLCDWSLDTFELVDGEWCFILDDDEKTVLKMQDILGEEIQLLNSEHRDLPAKFILFYNDVTDAERFEKAKECPYFHCIFSIEDTI